SELQLRSLDPLVMFNQDGIILDVNEATVKAIGRTREDLIGTSFADYFADPEKARKGVMLVFETGEVRDYELIMKARDGTEILVAYHASVYRDQTGQVVGAFADARDITQRRRTEKAVLESEEKFKAISSSATDAIIMMDNEGNISYWNEAAQKIFGYSVQEALGKELHILLAPRKYHDDYRRAMPAFKATGRGLVVGKTLELEAVKKDGTGFPIELSVSVVKIEDKWHGAGIVRDITLRRQAEEEREALIKELREALAERSRSDQKIQNLQRYNRALIEASLDPFVTFDQKGIVLDVNEAKVRATGKTREELIGTPFAKYFTDRDKAFKGVMLVFETGEVRDYELVMKAMDGTETIVSYNASVYRDQNGQVVGAFGVARDITELKRSEAEVRRERDKVKEAMQKLIEMQDKLIRSERFAAIGEAAAYLSHEIKNPLALIGGFAGQIERSLGEDYAADRQKLIIIQDEIRRLELMLTEVRDFTRPSKPQKELQDINSIIESTLTLLENDLRERGVDYEKHLDADLPSTLVDPRQIEQVLINLIKNAVESMPNGGKVFISSWLDDQRIKVSIEDTGVGMSPELADKIFNPFFTTKKKGTGLGLAVCRKIMEDHEGRISMQSEEGKWTKITIDCPAAGLSGEERP
ncbi:MAG: PAS domain S-box protein, partial [Desulfobulbaceae bacterium]|nr:PAS domain S-box protein [Desulfobulbaceae bacterium]